MILLSGHSLTPDKIIPDEALSLTLKERDSTASWEPAAIDGITVNSWLQGRGGPGDGIVWRIRSIREAYGSDKRTIELEHVISTLKDRILFGEITPETITGTDGATSCTAKQAIQYILSQQSDWELGTFSNAYVNVSGPYKFDGDNLFDAIKKVTDTLDNVQWGYTLTAYPFKLHIKTAESNAVSELRAGRNLKALSRTVDKSAMYTRFYPIGADDLHVTGDYVSKNESTYGVICKTEVDQTKGTEAELTAWANERLGKHAEPCVRIQAEGLELADATGVSMDRMKLGRVCRIPLPEYGTMLSEKIVELYYCDAVNDPENVRVTLSNEKEDVTSVAEIIASAIKNGSSGSAGRTSARTNGEYRTRIDQDEYHIGLVSEHVDHANAVLQAAGIDINSQTGVIVYHDDVANGVAARLSVQSSQIAMVVTGTGQNASINAASIVAAINQQTGQSSVSISADKVTIGNLSNEDLNSWAQDADNGTGVFAKFLTVRTLTAQEINTILANIGSAEISLLDVADLTVDQIACNGDLAAGDTSVDSLSLNNSSPFTDCIIDITKSGNTITWTYAGGGSDSFSKVTLVSGSWGDNATYRVEPDANGAAYASTTILQGVTGSGASAFVTAYHDSAITANELVSKTLTMEEDVSNKKVLLKCDNITKAEIGTQNTYNAGASTLTNPTNFRVVGNRTSWSIISGSGSGATVRISNIDCAWEQNGTSKTNANNMADSYLQAVPTEIYRAGYAACAAGFTNIGTMELFSYNAMQDRYYTQGTHHWYYT